MKTLRFIALTAAAALAAMSTAVGQETLPFPATEVESQAPERSAATQEVIVPEISTAGTHGIPAPVEPDAEEVLHEAAAALVAMLSPEDLGGPPMAECAVDLLRTRLATAVATDDVLTAVALESELLALCKERQQLVAEVLTMELALAALAVGETEPALAPAPPPVVAPPVAVLEQLLAPIFAAPEELRPEPAPEPAPHMAWSTVLGTAGNLRAALTDGADVWWVSEGTTLPGGLTVTRIAAQPPGVTVSHETGYYALPFHAAPQPGEGG